MNPRHLYLVFSPILFILSSLAAQEPTLPKSVEEGISIFVDTGGEWADLHVVTPGNESNVALLIQNETDRAIWGTLYLGLQRSTFVPVKMNDLGERRLAPNATLRLPFTHSWLGRDRGMRYVHWHFAGEGGRGHGVIPLAIMDPVGSTPGIDRSGDGFIFGIAGGMRIYKKSEWKKTFFKAAGLIGCEAYRVDMSWNRLEPTQGRFEWAGLDEMVALAQDQGMFIQPLMAYGNPWALSESSKKLIAERQDQKHNWRYPVKLEHWADFCRAVASRYTPEQMNYYEIWNEADIGFWKGSADEYADMLITSYNTIKKVNPELIVTTTGFTNLDHRTHRREIVTATFTKARDHFDVLAWHRHGPFGGFQDEIDRHLWPLRKEYGVDRKPIVFNETALGLTFEQEADLAASVVKKMTFSWARGAIGHYWYNLAKSHPHYVMMNDNWTPRPNYVAYNELARHLRGRKFSHEIDLGAGRFAFAFHGRGTFSGRSDRDYCIVAWVQDTQLGDQALTLKAGTRIGGAAVYDVMGNRREVSADEGLAFVTVTHEPQFIELEGCDTKPAVQEPVIGVSEDLVLLRPGKVSKANTRIYNPLSRAADFDMTWRVPDGITVRTARGRFIHLAAGESKSMSLVISGTGKNLLAAVDLSASIGGTNLVSETSVPVAIAKQIPVNAGTDRPADFVMDRAGQVANDNDIIPSLKHLMWQGPRDLSAKLWLNVENEALVLTVDVMDDKHNNGQHYSTADQGDCVEVGLVLPGETQWYNMFLYKENSSNPGQGRAHFRHQPSHTRPRKLWGRVKPQATKTAQGIRYRAFFRYEDFDLSPEILAAGIRFNVIIHDNDGEVREGSIRFSESLGSGRQPERFPVVVFKY